MKPFLPLLLLSLLSLILSQSPSSRQFDRFPNEDLDKFRENRKGFLDQLRKNITEIRDEMINRKKDALSKNKPFLENCNFENLDECKENCNSEDSKDPMCGILAIFGIKGDPVAIRKLAVRLSRRQKHRGPDESGIYFNHNPQTNENNVICQERLAINDLSECGKQPFLGSNGEFVYASNGETYNYPEIRRNFGKNYNFIGNSDGEGMGCLYEYYGGEIKFLDEMEGMWGLIFYNIKKNEFLIGRDHIGIIPIYYGVGLHGEKYISSELKAIHDQCEWVDTLLPGHYLTNTFVPIQWYKPRWQELTYIPSEKFQLNELRTRFAEAVKEQLLGDVPFGLLISGGVDSSIVASIVMKLVKSGEIDIKKRGMTEVPSFCVGIKGSPDLEAARKVAQFIGTTHYDIHFTVEEGIDALEEVIYHTETFNPTTIRASTPMFLMARRIKNYGIKMVMTGEGADELFGGYLYFHKAPNKEEFHQELIRKMNDLYKYDLLRANKSCLAWGVEVRPPFLHKKFIEYVMGIPPELKMPKNNEKNIEKYILRKAFDDENDPYLPSEILWRQKEQFSDGVGYSWINGVRDLVEKSISDEVFQNANKRFPYHPPFTKEMYLFRNIFESFFPTESSARTVPYAKSIACSTEKALEWDESFKKNTDESGRAVLGVHKQEVKLSKA